MECLGFRVVVSKKDGTKYREIYLLESNGVPNVTGTYCETVFLREDMIINADKLVPGASVRVLYSRFGQGRVDSLEVLSK